MKDRKFRVSEFIHGADYNPDQWLDMPDIIEEDFRLFVPAGMNSATIGIFSWNKFEPQEEQYNFAWLDQIMDRMADAKMKVILATPSGARPAWMDKKYPEILRVSSERVRNLHGIRHNHCWQSPYYRRKTQQINRILAERYGKHPALFMWHISNEYQGECHCDLCQKAFRDWLRKKYHNDMKLLNHEWCTDVWSHGFGSFDEIESPSNRGEHLIHGMNLDWRRFVTEETLDFFQNECVPLRELTPDIPITTNFMGQNMDFNQWKLAPYMDIMSWDSYPEWSMGRQQDMDAAIEASFCHDRFRSMKMQPFLVMESTPSLINWRTVNKLKRPGMHELSVVQAIAHGADSIQYFQWRKCRGEGEKLHGAVIDHYGKEDTRVFQEVSRVGELLGKMQTIAGSDTDSKAAVLYDWENSWAIEDLQGWRSPRLYLETVYQHYKALRKLGINVDVIDEETPLDKYRIVAAPMLYMLRSGIAERLKQFAAKGGSLILTYGTGEVNENDLCYLGGFPAEGLMELAGLRAEEMDVLCDGEYNGIRLSENNKIYQADSYCELIYPKEGCEVLAFYTDDFYAGKAAVTRNQWKAGACFYIATRPEQKYLDTLYQQIAQEQGMELLWGILPEGIDLAVRRTETEEYYFIMNFSGESVQMPLPKQLQNSSVFPDGRAAKEIYLEKYGYIILKN